MTELLQVDDRGVVIHSSPDRRRGGRLLLGLTLVYGVTLLVITIVQGVAWLWALQVVTVFFALLSVLLSASDQVTRFDVSRRVMVNSGLEIPFDDLLCVVAIAELQVHRSREGNFEQWRWTLGLMTASAGADVRRALGELRAQRKAALERPELARVPPHLGRVQAGAQGHLFEIVDYPDEGKVWRAAEWIAKNLDLPLLDACSVPNTLRIPEELDVPLGERLVRGFQQPAENASKPAGCQADVADDRLILSWKYRRGWEIVMLALGPGVVLWAAWFTWYEALPWWISSLLLLIALPLLQLPLLGARWHGTNSIVVDRRRLVIRPGPFGRKLLSRPTDQLEGLRLRTQGTHPALSVIADDAVVWALMSPEVGAWARHRLERHLMKLYTKG